MDRSALCGAESMSTGKAVVIVENVVIDCATDRRAGRAPRGAADESSDHGPSEPAEHGADRTGNRADDRAGFRARECRGHAARGASNAADRAASFAGAIACVDAR